MLTEIKRGDVYYIQSDDSSIPFGHEMWPDRYAVIVSNDTTNKNASCVQVVYCSSARKYRQSPSDIPVVIHGKKSMVLTSQMYTVDKRRIRMCIDTLKNQELQRIDHAITLQLGIQQVAYRSLFKKWENYIRKYQIDMYKEQIESIPKEEHIRKLEREVSLLSCELEGYKAIVLANQERLKEKENEK